MKNNLLVILTAFLLPISLFAQADRKDKTPVTYEELYDEPYSINKLFVAFQPLYGELFVTNVNAGFGAEVNYLHQDKFDIRASFRKTYSRKFFDFSRDLALNSQETKQDQGKAGYVDNRAQVFNYYEIGATYHIKDFEMSSKTRMFLYKSSYKRDRWSARVPLYAEIPCKVRKVYGARAGVFHWKSAVNLSRTLEKQNLTNESLLASDGTPLPSTLANGDAIDVFSNISSTAIYVGGSMSWIKNVAVSFDKFEEGIDDLMLTVFFDVLVSPSIRLDDVVFTSNRGTTDAETNTYSISPIKTQLLGFRAGIDGRFNRTLSWAYGGEIGMRPGIKGQGLYALIKISFPIYGTNLDYKVESFGK